jgi:ABC-type transport system involved in cytochrome bd biosynthesis fused ATPase/permease subunit
LIIVLRDGGVAEQGSHEELLNIEGGVYRHLWEAQLTENTQVQEKDEDVKVKEEVVVRK